MYIMQHECNLKMIINCGLRSIQSQDGDFVRLKFPHYADFRIRYERRGAPVYGKFRIMPVKYTTVPIALYAFLSNVYYIDGVAGSRQN